MSTRQPSPPRRRRPPRDDVRRALLDSAARVFARHGIDGATLDDVAADAGFTKGAVYSNFRSKEGLVDALMEDRTSAYLDLGLESIDDIDDATMAVRAQVLGDRLTAASDEQHDWHLLFFELWQRAVRTDADSTFRDRRSSLRAAVTDAIEEHAARAGATLPMSPSDLATVLMALANGLAVERMVAPEEVSEDLMGRVLALIVGNDPAPGAG